MTIHGDLYYEGKEFETRLKEKKPGDLTEELRTALGMPTGPVSILPKQSICMCISAQDSSWYAYRTSEYIAKSKYLYVHFSSGQLLVCLQDQ